MILKTNFRNRHINGFTLVEIMVAVGIIGLLLTMAVPNFINTRKKTRAVHILNEFTTIEKAMLVMFADANLRGWCKEADFGLGGNPTISDIYDNTDLKNYLNSKPSSPVSGTEYRYDNDGDTGSGVHQGVNLILGWAIDKEYFTLLDEKVDKGDGADAGKIMWNGNGVGAICWHIADSGG